jgi:hypothetical protein
MDAAQSGNGGPELVLELGEGGLVELAPRHDHDVESGRQPAVAPEDLTHQALCPVALDRAPELAGCRNPQAPVLEVVREGEQRERAARRSGPMVIDPPELGAFLEPLPRSEALIGCHPHAGRWAYRYDTDSRFRPLARRRFKTIRPFFVLIRTRNPWVRRRRRRLGWNVRFMIRNPR